MRFKTLLKIDLDSKRIYGLDILRALAILFVVLGHGMNLLPEDKFEFLYLFVFDGVSIFFVLSGFLIGKILIKVLAEEQLTYKTIGNFWIRRWLRTLPNYFLILTVLLFLHLLFEGQYNLWDLKSYFVFTQNLFTVHPAFFPEAWSLSIEEWFYILIPIILFILLKVFKISLKKSLLLSAIGVIISVSLFRYYRFETFHIMDISTWDYTLRKQVVTRLDSIMYGVIGAYIFVYHQAFWEKFRIHFFVIGLALFITMKMELFDFPDFGLFHSVFSFSITSLATLFLLPFLSMLKKGSGVVFKSLTTISLISYSMYLINLTLVQKWILGSIDWTNLEAYNSVLFYLLRYSLYWMLTVVISILLYKFFEIPLMNLRDKINL